MAGSSRFRGGGVNAIKVVRNVSCRGPGGTFRSLTDTDVSNLGDVIHLAVYKSLTGKWTSQSTLPDNFEIDGARSNAYYSSQTLPRRSLAPTSLVYGEIAVTIEQDTQGTYLNKAGRLFVGNAAQNPVEVGGEYYTELLNHQPGQINSNSAIITGAAALLIT